MLFTKDTYFIFKNEKQLQKMKAVKDGSGDWFKNEKEMDMWWNKDVIDIEILFHDDVGKIRSKDYIFRNEANDYIEKIENLWLIDKIITPKTHPEYFI